MINDNVSVLRQKDVGREIVAYLCFLPSLKRAPRAVELSGLNILTLLVPDFTQMNL